MRKGMKLGDGVVVYMVIGWIAQNNGQWRVAAFIFVCGFALNLAQMWWEDQRGHP